MKCDCLDIAAEVETFKQRIAERVSADREQVRRIRTALKAATLAAMRERQAREEQERLNRPPWPCLLQRLQSGRLTEADARKLLEPS